MKSNLNPYETYEASHIEINLIFELACIENKNNKIITTMRLLRRPYSLIGF